MNKRGAINRNYFASQKYETEMKIIKGTGYCHAMDNAMFIFTKLQVGLDRHVSTGGCGV